MATLGLSEADKAAVEAFRQDVVEPSRTSLVIVDFWAEWCGPCKQLAPVIEKVCADYASKGVKLVKVNVDENGFIASQFRVQSIPTVYAVFQGQPVADLTQARTEGQLKQYLDQLLSQLPIESDEKAQEQEIAPLIAMGEEMLAEGDAERALSVFGQIDEMVPGHPEVVAGLARALVALGQLDEADALLAALPADVAKDQAVDRARAAIALARNAKPVADLSGVEAQVAADPDDHAARFELAIGLMGNGDRDAAAEQLLEIVRRDRAWNDSAARTQLLTLFEAVGLEDPWVSAQRRKLSQILFSLTIAPVVNRARVSIFPLSGALLLPGMELPLHIFEPRYRALIEDASARDRRIGMIQPRGKGPRPDLFDMGCLGRISQIEALDDGRFNIILTGLARFRVVRELEVATQFRQIEAEVEQAPDEDEALHMVERAALEQESRRFADALGYAVDWTAVSRLDDMALVNGIAQIAPFDPAAKQTLLEADTLSERADRIIQLMQIVGRAERDGGATMQ